MSHKADVFSLAGTPLQERTVGELVAERPGRSRVLQNFGIDFCCQGSRTLREACKRKNVSLETVVEQLEAELADQGPTARMLQHAAFDLKKALHSARIPI